MGMRSLGSARATEAMDQVIALRGKLKLIICGIGAEFTSKQLDARAYRREISIGLIQIGAPGETGSIESFNRSLRDCVKGRLIVNTDAITLDSD